MTPVILRRAQIKSGVKGVNTTARGNVGTAQYFSPPWELVRAYKYRGLSEQKYTDKYLQILDKAPQSAWQWLADQAEEGAVTVLCFCRDSWFCHTHILIDYAVQHHPQLFRRA